MRWVGVYLATVSGSAFTLLTLFLLQGHVSGAAVWPAALVGLSLAAAAWFRQGATAPSAAPSSGTWADRLTVTLGLLFAVRVALWLAWEHNGKLFVGSPYNLGDFCLHLTHLRHLGEGARFWPSNPIAGADPIAYPIGMTLWQFLLEGLGLPVLSGFALATLVGLVCGVFAAWRWGGAFGLAALLCNGGLAGWAVLGGRWTDFQADLAWKNIPLAMLVTQRGFLYALPAGLWLMWRWRDCLTREDDRPGWLEIWIYATLPLFHLHTFLTLSGLLAVRCAFGPQRRRALLHGLAALPVATWLVWLCTGGGRQTGAAGLAWGWFAREGEGAPAALWANFGPWLPLLPALALWLAWRMRRGASTPEEREAASWVWPGIALLVFTLAWRLQPWAWDNTKLMLWGWLMTVPFVGRLWVNRLPRRSVWAAWALLFGGGCATLLAGMAQGMRGGYPVAKLVDIDSAELATRDVPRDALIAAAPDYNQPLLLAGRTVVLGYEGHLWSHGIDYRERLKRLNRLMNGQADWRQDARDLGVRYLYWGRLESRAYPQSRQPWVETATVVATTPGGTLYRLDD